jgi:hypothetical protein
VKSRLAAAAIVVAVTTAACGGGSSSSTSASDVPQVVSGKAWPSVRVTSGTTSADIPPNTRKALVPFLASRVFTHPGPLPEYGLDHPAATLTYTSPTGTAAEVDIGQPNFDRHFVYVQRRGRPAVYLVPADTLRPVLALVGVDIKPPD